MGFPAVFSWTYEVKRFRNLGYSLLATALRTEAGAQPPGFTAARGKGSGTVDVRTYGKIIKKLQTSHVSGSFSFVAKIFLMADR
ncbi:hypothetical protein EYF80_015525 [Liparis tanakae]|uniref:Uncharacterized protein n=1 Tax=Liparis tanakae TaxID=230148 RepID=A0A4Z2IA58_9TELE|nr:hypothetical protein EYF80_015525 [Liparis tanakae]